MSGIVPFTLFNPEPTATASVNRRAVAVGSGLNEVLAIAALLVLSASIGCTATKPHAKSLPKPDPARSIVDPATSPTSKSEQLQLVHEFEERRDAAQLGAAIDRWKQGDEADAEGLLTNLLERSPDHREARRTLADLYATRPTPSAALEHLLYLVEHDPADAQAQHSLGLLLQTLNRRSEALQHFEQAVKLEPQNELYVLSRDACREP